MHRRTGSGNMNRSGPRNSGGGGGYNRMGGGGGGGYYEQDYMDEMAYRREMMQRGMMGDMQFYGGMMGNMGMGMPMGMMDRGMMGMGGMNSRGGGGRGGPRGGPDRRDRNAKGPGPRSGQSGPGRRDGGRNDRNQRPPPPGRSGMQRNRSDPGQGSHQRRLSDLRNDRDQNRRRDREQAQWDRRGGPHDLHIKESGPLGKIKAIARRIKEWGNFGYGLPFWNRRANIYRRLANFLERGNLDHTIVFIGHGSDCVCRLYIDGLYLAEGSGASKSEARSDAYYRAVERMRIRNFDSVISIKDKFNVESLRGYEVDQVISESPGNNLTFESNYANVATNRVADFNYPWEKLTLVERTGMSNAGLKLRLSANLNGLLLEQNTSKAVPPGEVKPQWKFSISLEHKLLAEEYHDRQGIARSNACLEAMNKLEVMCYTVKIERHRFPKINASRDDRGRRGGRRGEKKDDKTESADGKTETKEEDAEKEGNGAEKEEDAGDKADDTAEGDQTKEDHVQAEEDDQDGEEEDDSKPFVPPPADLRRSDLVDTDLATKDDEEEEEKEDAADESKDETTAEGDDDKEGKDEEGGETKEGEGEKDEKKEDVSQLQKRLKEKMESEAKQRKKAEFLFKIRKAIEDKMVEFAASRNFGQLVLEGFWLEERDHVVRLCRKMKLRSYVDKYRNADGKIVHYIFVSQIIPMEELVEALKTAPENKLGSYSLHPPKTVEEVEEAKRKREESIKAKKEKYQAKVNKEGKKDAKK